LPTAVAMTGLIVAVGVAVPVIPLRLCVHVSARNWQGRQRRT
jgi:hypothetical protein